MRGWFESTFGAGALAAQFVVALIVVIVLFGIIAVFARRRKTKAGRAHTRGRQPRLAVMDMTDVDDRRRLILIRRDNVEHLVMIGGPSDLVVESTIVRNRPVPHAATQQAAERGPDVSAAGLAVQPQLRPPNRASSTPAVLPEAASADGPAKGSPQESVEAHTSPPVRGTQFVNPYKTPELARDDKTPPSSATAGQKSPPAAPARSDKTASSAPSAAAVAGLAAGAAALTAAAASVKRREPSADLEIPPEKPVKDAPVLPVGFNGSDSITAPAQDAEKPQPAAKEPAAGKDAAEGMKEADAKTAVEAAPKPEKVPDAAADAKSEATSATDANAASDKPADANSEGRVSDETPVTEPVEAAESEKIESAGKTGEAGAGESPGMTQLKDAAAAAAETGSADNAVEDGIEVALADALSPAQGQPTNLPDASAEAAASTLLEAVKIDVEMASPVSDTATGTQATTEAAAAEPPSPAKSFEEIMAEHAPGDGLDIAAPPQTDTTVAPVPEAAPTPGDAKAEAAGQTVDPSPQRPAAISPFPTIPEDVRRSVLEAARRAEGSLDADPAMTDGGTKTTLGDLAERLEQALAEQASTLSGQLKPNADTKPAASHAPADSAQNPAASIEAWESGELVSSGPPAADSEAGAAASLAEQSGAGDDAEPRQSQAMLEDETDSGVIDFSDRKKASPEDAPSDSLEDEMARLLGELTGGKSAG